MKIELITGPMFCGKTDELLRRLSRWGVTEKTVLLFKPDIDTRSEEELVSSRSGSCMSCIPIRTVDASSIIKAVQGRQEEYVIGIDELQFFEHYMDTQIEELVMQHKCHVIAAGLNRDYKGHPFEMTRRVMGLADDITTLTSICHHCLDDGATETYRLSSSDERIEIDTGANYEARHRWCT